jgi:hypothetical protein
MAGTVAVVVVLGLLCCCCRIGGTDGFTIPAARTPTTPPPPVHDSGVGRTVAVPRRAHSSAVAAAVSSSFSATVRSDGKNKKNRHAAPGSEMARAPTPLRSTSAAAAAAGGDGAASAHDSATTTTDSADDTPTLNRKSPADRNANSRTEEGNSRNNRSVGGSLRVQLRRWTGFSLTAVRAAVRAATGISLTAVSASTVAISGAWIRQGMRLVLGLFPAWARYFVQPLLVLYYAPLFILRNLVAQQQQPSNSGMRRHNNSNAVLLLQQKSKHEHLVEGWKRAVEMADETSSYWPLHLDSEGNLESDIHEINMNDAVAESVEMAAAAAERAAANRGTEGESWTN